MGKDQEAPEGFGVSFGWRPERFDLRWRPIGTSRFCDPFAAAQILLLQHGPAFDVQDNYDI